MSAELLREAAALIRERFEREDVDDLDEAEFYLAVADWLDDQAERPNTIAGYCDEYALAVARTYLGRQS